MVIFKLTLIEFSDYLLQRLIEFLTLNIWVVKMFKFHSEEWEILKRTTATKTTQKPVIPNHRVSYLTLNS